MAGRVGHQFGLPVASVALANRDGVVGVISRRVLGDQEELQHGNELLAECGVTTENDHDRTGYTLEAVKAVLDPVGPPAGHESLPTAFDWFTGYLLLDCLVGNTDRHQDNWGVIRVGAHRRLCPSFDHASCLGFLLSDESRMTCLTTPDRNRAIPAYARRAVSKFASQPSLLQVALDALRMASPEARGYWSREVERADDLSLIVEQMPEERMSTPAKRFAAALYVENHGMLSQAIRTMEQ